MKRIVTIGGGTGQFTLLSGLKKYPFELSAIVTMADDGGSTGVLRDELGVLPPGDIRQCLVALSESDKTLRELFLYRFESGALKGHNFGNLFLSALEKMTGNFNEAVKKAAEILRIRGKVIPVTLDNVRLVARFPDGRRVEHENNLGKEKITPDTTLFLNPLPIANPEAINVILNADAVILGPGNFYLSLIPNLLVPGIIEALKKTPAKKIYICNLMNKENHTGGFTVSDYLEVLSRYTNGNLFDYVVYNTQQPPEELLSRYAEEGEFVEHARSARLCGLTQSSSINEKHPDSDFAMVAEPREKPKFVGANLLSEKLYEQKPQDPIRRTLIRHDPDKLANILIKLV